MPHRIFEEGYSGLRSYETAPDSSGRSAWWADSGSHHASSRQRLTALSLADSRVGRFRLPLELTEAEAAPAYDAEEQNNIAVYKRVLPSVVNITSTTLVFNFFYGTVPQQGQGSGFILDKAGHVLTNFHVVEGANRGIEVMLSNKRRYPANVVGTDKVHDLALLQIDAPNLQPVTLADSCRPQRRPEGLRHRQSLRPQRHHDPRHHQLHPLHSQRRTARRLKTPSRPMRPSIPATPAARCSTRAAKSSASTP